MEMCTRITLTALSQKLSKLCHLPKNLQPIQGSIDSLRIDVPAQFWSGATHIQVKGVEVDLKLTKEGGNTAKTPPKSPKSGHSTTLGGTSDDDILPTIKEVAKEFLEAEPEEERQEIEAAIQSQSVTNIDESTSEASVEDLTLGTGFPLSAYSYIEGAIRGIIDRLEVSIEDVTFVVHFDAQVESGEDEVESSLRFRLEELEVEGLTSRISGQSRRGKRSVKLRQIHADLTSSSALFASLQRISSFPSRSTTQSSPAISREIRSPSPVSQMSSSVHQSTASTMLKDNGDHSANPSTLSQLNTGELGSTPSGNRNESYLDLQTRQDDRFADASDEEDEDHRFLMSSQLDFGKHASSSKRDTGEVFPFDMDVSGMQRSKISTSSSSERPNTSIHQSMRSEHGTSDSVLKESNFLEGLKLHASAPRLDASHSNSSSGSSSVGEDLSESRFFTHEEAQSMYQSAMSEISRPILSASTQRTVDKITPAQSLPANQTRSDKLSRSELQSSIPHDDASCETPTPKSPRLDVISSVTDSVHRLNQDSTQESFNTSELVTKKLISIDEIAILVPWARQTGESFPEAETQSETSSTDQSTDFQMPGAFSFHGSKGSKEKESRKATREKNSTTDENTANITSGSAEEVESLKDIQIAIGSLDGKVDLSSGRVLFALVEQVVQSLQSMPSPTAPSSNTPSSEQSTGFSIGLKLDHLKLSLQEHLSHILNISQPGHGLNRGIPSQDSLLVLDMHENDLSLTLGKSISMAKFCVRQFLLGFPDEKIISFDTPVSNKGDGFNAGASSVIHPPTQNDITISYKSNEGRGPELHVDTRRLCIDMNLPRIDEKLTSYGGLSGILDLSSSIASNSTMLVPQVRATSPHTTAEEPTVPPNSTDASLTPKVNVRVDGVKFSVQGRACGVRLRTNTVKAVVRESNITVRTSHVQLTGPVEAKDPLIIDILEPELSFFFSPGEADLTLLLSLITPSRDPYEDEEDILLDTLLRQRQKGSLIRVSIRTVEVKLHDKAVLEDLQSLSGELSKFQNVAKYLPDDDRPGILSIVDIEKFRSEVSLNSRFGTITALLSGTKLAHVGLPSLLAMEVGEFEVWRNDDEIIHNLLPLQSNDKLPVIMGKIIGDEMEPTIKVKLFNLAVEYQVSTLMAFMGLSKQATTEDLAASMVQSVATIRGGLPSSEISRNPSGFSDSVADSRTKPLQLSVQIRDCGIGLNPVALGSKGIFLLAEAHMSFKVTPQSPMRGNFELRKGSLHLIDDIELLNDDYDPASRSLPKGNIPASIDLSKQGYRSMVTISSANVVFKVSENDDGKPLLLVHSTNEVIYLETCADSTQTLIQLFDGLKPPSIPESNPHYHLNPMLPQDLMDSFCGEAFEQDEPDTFKETSAEYDEGELLDALSDDSFEMVGSFYSTAGNEEESGRRSSVTHPAHRREHTPGGPGYTNRQMFEVEDAVEGSSIRRMSNKTILSTDPFKTIRSWNSTLKQHDNTTAINVKDCPFRLELQVTTFVWNLFDGYDWVKTREVITEAVEKVQEKAAQRLATRRRSQQDFDEDESEIGDTLFQSIWIAVPANDDGNGLRRRINREMDMASESTTITTAITQKSENASRQRRGNRSLKLSRSHRHKVSIEIRKLKADVNVLPPGIVETQSAIDLHVGQFEIYDHVPTSSWRKFVTIMREAGTPPLESPMAHLHIQTVKPKLELAATELVIKATVLPLRLHVDQDTLDFITRFFEFKDESKPESTTPTDPPFIQRCEVRAVPLKLDYKPKKVDYAGLRSGRTKEFMNFVTLEEADIELRRLILYGITGFDNLHKSLNDIWVSDVTRRQLPVVIQGLAPLRPLVNVGKGLLQVIVVPIQEHQRDGRYWRSVRKGIFAAANATTAELARLGGKLAIGTGNVLETAHGLLTTPSPSSDHDTDPFTHSPQYAHLSSSPSQRPVVSAYANQPLTVPAALRSASRHIERELTAMQDGIIAVGVDVSSAATLGGKAWAMARGAPVVILRPIIGGTRAVGVTFLGAANALDKDSRLKLEDVSAYSLLLCEEQRLTVVVEIQINA
jgi:autophagy-related protein 2